MTCIGCILIHAMRPATCRPDTISSLPLEWLHLQFPPGTSLSQHFFFPLRDRCILCPSHSSALICADKQPPLLLPQTGQCDTMGKGNRVRCMSLPNLMSKCLTNRQDRAISLVPIISTFRLTTLSFGPLLLGIVLAAQRNAAFHFGPVNLGRAMQFCSSSISMRAQQNAQGALVDGELLWPNL